MKTEYTMLLHTIERKHGLNPFVLAEEGYPYSKLVQMMKVGYIEKLNKYAWWITPRGQQFLTKVRAHFLT